MPSEKRNEEGEKSKEEDGKETNSSTGPPLALIAAEENLVRDSIEKIQNGALTYVSAGGTATPSEKTKRDERETGSLLPVLTAAEEGLMRDSIQKSKHGTMAFLPLARSNAAPPRALVDAEENLFISATGAQLSARPQPPAPGVTSTNRHSEIRTELGTPMPMPSMVRTAARAPPARPGAYPVQSTMAPLAMNQGDAARAPWDISGTISSRDLDASTELFDRVGTRDSNQDGLAVANLVDESMDFISELPRAVEDNSHVFDSDRRNAAANRDEETKQYKTNVLMGGILLLAIAMILLAILVPVDEEIQETQAPTGSPTQGPTQAPTTLVMYYESLLPEETVQTIEEDPQSSQAQAFDWLLEDPALESLSEERIKQRFVLATLYFATSGDNWKANDNWLNHSVHECEWYNKPDFALTKALSNIYPSRLKDFFPPTDPSPSVCDRDYHYQHLWLDQNSLDGTLPPELYTLTSLKTLSVGFNNLLGTIPTHIAQLSLLEGANFENLRRFSGTVPSEFGLMTKLRYLSVMNNQQEGVLPSEIWQLSNLVTMNLFRNPLLKGSIPTEIGMISNLRFFAAAVTSFTGTLPSEIFTLPLENLALFGNKLRGTLPTEIGQLTTLRVSGFADTSLEGSIPSEFGRLSRLIGVTFRAAKFSGTIPTEMGLLEAMEVNIGFRENQFTGTIPSELGLLSGTLKLEFANNRLTGQIPSEFGNLETVGDLTFANNSLSGTVPQELSRLQHHLHTLTLEGNPLLTGTIPHGVCNMNGTCIGHVIGQCDSVYQGPFGLFFDCTETLCGCDCPCLDG
ncbi:Leucine Rich Repeat [Seminavis robusta]|uniref:Leucine Rich Repeat n=1 Tax=Seminavis robusta TaxID=568900 RepID=A0A9N8HQD6_9STRA|nr:Leucine Rich Repeat [Seminavis robusta]|eukprot:Sro1156_g247240.1 Leucine Rich Repeat (800) ;mRNA; r:4208-6693